MSFDTDGKAEKKVAAVVAAVGKVVAVSRVKKEIKNSSIFSHVQADFRSVEELKNAGKPHEH